MSGTDLTYNGVTLKDVQTLRFDQAIQWDESDTDALYHRFNIRVRGSVHSDQLRPHGVSIGATGTATTIMAALHRKMMQPRKVFNYVVNGATLLTARPARNTKRRVSNQDFNNGPRPRACDIVQLFGSSLYSVEFEIELALVQCDGADDPARSYGAARKSGVINNRWSLSDGKDGNFYSTKTVEGVLRVSHADVFPHCCRHLVVPPLQDGYRRESQRFTDSPDGLSLRYEVTDQQRFAAPPSPATDWTATYTETTGEGGAIGFGEMNVSLTGAPDVEPFRLVETGAKIVLERLEGLQRQYYGQGEGDHAVVLLHMAIVEYLHESRIDMSARVQHTPKDGAILNARIAGIGDPLDISGYDPKKWPIPKLYDGSSPSGLFAKYLQSPCSDVHGITQVVPCNDKDDQQRNENDQGDPEFFEAPEPILLDNQRGVSQGQRQSGFPYMHYQISTRYETRGGYAQLPYASTSQIGATCALIQLHAPTQKRIITVHAERIGDWPQVPSPLNSVHPDGIAVRMNDFVFLPEQPDLLADGKTRVYKTQGRYEQLLDRPVNTASGRYVPGTDPRDESTVSDNLISARRVFTPDLMETQ